MEDYKLAFIYGAGEEVRGLIDGEIQNIGNAHDKDELHINCLLKFAKNKYGDVNVFNRLNHRHRPEIAAYFFSLFGHIVFFNITRDAKKYGKMGLFIMPLEITDKQKESLTAFVKTIDDFHVDICYDLKLIDGILDGREIQAFNGETPEKLLEIYYKRASLLTTKSKTI